MTEFRAIGWAALLALGLALALTAGAQADPLPPGSAGPAMAAPAKRAAIRTGTHPEFGRVVIDLPPGVTASASADGPGGVLVRVTGGVLGAAGPAPRNVTAIAVAGTETRLTLAPGARFTVMRLQAHLVIDVSARAEAALPLPPAAPGKLAAATAVAPAAPTVAPGVAPPQRQQPRFSGPPPRHPAPAAEPMPAAAARAAPAAPAPVPAAPVSPAPVPAPAPALDIAAGRPEPVRMPLQSLLSGSLPNVLRPLPPAAPPAEPPERTMAAPVTAVDRAPLPPPAGADAATKPAADAAAMMGGPLAIAAGAAPQVLQLPFDATTGAAAFRRGGEVVVVFDERRPIDLAALRGDAASAFADARVQLLATATVLRLTLPAEEGLQLTHTDDGWTLARVVVPPELLPIRGDVANGLMQLAAAAPGAVVSVPDPMTGGALLVGTQLQAGQGVPVARRTPDFTLLQTLQGVAVEPVSDAITLRVAPAKQVSGFVLAADSTQSTGTGVALDPMGPEALAALEAARMTRRWDFPALPTAALLRRLEAATDDASAAAPESRTARRLQAVQAEIALGLGAEANSLADLAIAEDARAADSPDAAGLAAIGALLAGRLDQADAIADPRLNGTDEVTLWRAVRLAMQHQGAPEAAVPFAATLPLLLAYPSALRARLLPLAAETMVLGGEREAARRLLEARKADAALDYSRALLAELDGHAAPALAIYDRLAQSPDRRERARAAARAAELRLRTGAFTTAQAADALDKLIYAWRGGPEELALRLRVADLRTQSGNWRAALALLRETSGGELLQNWPDQGPAIRARMGEVFSQALAVDVSLPPLDLASLVDENPDMLPDGEPGRALAARLAERLVALDLPKRAAPVLEKLMNATAPGAARAELGARLAALKLEQSDPAGALLALSASTATDLPPALDEARTIAFARATAARGGLGPATAALEALNAPAADEARATLLEQAKDWQGAVQALASYAAKIVPRAGPLAEGQAQVLLRLASAAAQANDELLLGQLREEDLQRLPAGKTAELFRLLTERPVQNVGDLPRAAQEAALARDVPAALRAIGGAARP